MFPHPDTFLPESEVVIRAVAEVARFMRNDHRLTRRWRSNSSPGSRSRAWMWRVEDTQRLICATIRRIDLTELASNGYDDGLPSRQSARLRGLRDIAHQTINTIERQIVRKGHNYRYWWELVERLKLAEARLEGMAYGESEALRYA